MADGNSTSGPGNHQVGGPAAVASALRELDRHARTLVRHAITHHAPGDSSRAAHIGELHDRISRVLHGISLEHGTDAMSTSAEYAATALEAGSLYPGDELDEFLRDVAASVRATSKDLTRSTPFGS